MQRRKFLRSLGTAPLALSAANAATSAGHFAGMAATSPAGASGPYARQANVFLAHRLGTDHAEGLCLLDMNGDGRLDIASGAYWYENPGPDGPAWKRHQYRKVTVWPFTVDHLTTTEFVSDCGQFAVDVNHDGAPDIVSAAWQTDGIWWYENPKKADVLWKAHRICHSIHTEGMVMGDLDGDGHAELAAAHYTPSSLIWINFAGANPKVHYTGGKIADGHGVGMADINGDGRTDLLSIHGWLENIDAARDRWRWHPEWELGEAGFPILGYDVNNDGKMDLIYGHGHNYGLYWLEQTRFRGRRHWRRHMIDDSFSEVHALKLADIDGDGEPELITGKRYRADPDPGVFEPLVVYYYKLDRRHGRFTRYPLSYNGTAEIGTQIWVDDIDGDGDMDILLAGKTGVHWLENLRMDKVPAAVRNQEVLYNRNWPFPGEATNR